MPPQAGNRVLLGAIALVAVALALFVLLFPWKAQVSGATPGERIASICQLADRRPWGAEDAIAAAAATDSDASVRRAAVLCLAKFRRPSDRPPVEACTHDAAPSVRESAAMTLARYADRAATDRLAEMARGDASDEVRQAALVALDLQEGPAALAALLETMEDAPDIPVKERAAQLLVRKFGILIKPDSKNVPAWNNLVEMIKGTDKVQDAYRQVNKPLELHPEHVLPEIKQH